MNTDKIVEILKASPVDGFRVAEAIRDGWEFYFIRHRLDQNRIRHTDEMEITVYKAFEENGVKYLGSATAGAAPTDTEEDVQALVKELAQEALLVKNPYYPLTPASEALENKDNNTSSNKKGTGSTEESVSDGTMTDTGSSVKADQVVRDIAKSFITTMTSIPETATEDINSYEIFTDSVTKHLVTSTGIDLTTTYPSSMIEVVVNARDDNHEIELYRMYNSGTCDSDFLKGEITRTLHYGKDRLHTEPTPALGSCDVIFSTDAALEIYNYFVLRMSAGNVYNRISDWKPAAPIAPDAIGDKITLEAKKFLANSSDNAAFDTDGQPRHDLTIIQDGIAKQYFGSRQYASYLGVENAFVPGNFAISGGTHSEEALRSGTYLEVVEFSDFQVDPMSGDIFGEIRLGYLHDDKGTRIVSGGSVSGTMTDFAKTMEMSTEQKQYNNMLIPAVTKLHDVTITGVE